MQMQVCRPCLEGFGILVQAKPKPEAPRCPTLEELIMQIAQKAVVTVFEGDELRKANG